MAELLTLTLRDYLRQRRVDHARVAADCTMPEGERMKAAGAEQAFRDIAAFMDGEYRLEYLEAVADRAGRR